MWPWSLLSHTSLHSISKMIKTTTACKRVRNQSGLKVFFSKKIRKCFNFLWYFSSLSLWVNMKSSLMPFQRAEGAEIKRRKSSQYITVNRFNPKGSTDPYLTQNPAWNYWPKQPEAVQKLTLFKFLYHFSSKNNMPHRPIAFGVHYAQGSVTDIILSPITKLLPLTFRSVQIYLK